MKRTPAIVTPDDMPRGWLNSLVLGIVLALCFLFSLPFRAAHKYRRHTMKLRTALILIAILVVGIAWLALPRGGSVAVTGSAATHVALPGSANLLIVEHYGGDLCYYGVNMNTNQWATAYTATNCIPISNAQHRIERRGLNRLSFQGASTATTSRVHWAAF